MDVLLKILLLASPWLCEARVISPRQARLSLAEQMPSYYYSNIDGYPGTYAFGYDLLDPVNGNTQFRTEEKYPNGTVAGSYGYVDPKGKAHRYRYIADEWGYRVMNDASTLYGKQRNNDYIENLISSTESSVTWTRGPGKKKTKNDFIFANGIERRNDVNV